MNLPSSRHGGWAGAAAAACLLVASSWTERPSPSFSGVALSNRAQSRRSRCSHGRRVVATLALQGAALDIWEGYEHLLDTQGLLTDTATGCVISAMSDSIAQATEGRRGGAALQVSGGAGPKLDRILRYAVFGSMDGFAGHNWFEALDALLPKTDTWTVDTLLKVAADSAVYTPGWCVVFLATMAVLEGRGPAAAVQDIRRDFFDLLRGNYGITLPGVFLIYGCVPVRFQVAGFAALTLGYTIILSLWENAREAVGAESAAQP